MIRAKLKRPNGEIIAEIELPESAREISLARYVSFLSEMRKFELEGANPVRIMAQAVAELCGVDVAAVYEAELGETWDERKEAVDGVRSIYGWAVRALTNYKGRSRTGNDFAFEYKGETYQIPYIVAAELAGGTPVLPPITTAEAVEAFETIRGFDKQIKDAGDPKGERAKRIKELKEAIAKQGDKSGDMMREIKRLEAEIDIEGDPNGNLVFAQYLRTIAILARKDGERLPPNDGDRERWIQARMIHLQEIDAQTALDVDFFLDSLLTLSKRTHPVIGSLMLPLFALAVATQSNSRQKGKHIIKQSRTKRKYNGVLVGVR